MVPLKLTELFCFFVELNLIDFVFPWIAAMLAAIILYPKSYAHPWNEYFLYCENMDAEI